MSDNTIMKTLSCERNIKLTSRLSFIRLSNLYDLRKFSSFCYPLPIQEQLEDQPQGKEEIIREKKDQGLIASTLLPTATILEFIIFLLACFQNS